MHSIAKIPIVPICTLLPDFIRNQTNGFGGKINPRLLSQTQIFSHITQTLQTNPFGNAVKENIVTSGNRLLNFYNSIRLSVLIKKPIGKFAASKFKFAD